LSPNFYNGVIIIAKVRKLYGDVQNSAELSLQVHMNGVWFLIIHSLLISAIQKLVTRKRKKEARDE